MKGQQIKDLLQELHLLGNERDFSGSYNRNGYLPQWPNPRMGDSDFEYKGTTGAGDKDGTKKHQGSENKPWYHGISDFFGGFTNILSMVSGLFKGIGNLPQEELFNQGYSWLNQFTGANLTGKEQQMNAFNAEQAAIQRGWQERMSNTSFQRQVADMQAAGINPALSMGSNGASTPSGSAASGNASPAQASAILEMILGAKKIQTEKEMNLRSTASAEHIAEINAKSHIRAAEIAADATMYGSDKGYQGKHEEVLQMDINSYRQFLVEIEKNSILRNEVAHAYEVQLSEIKLNNAKSISERAAARLANASAEEKEKMTPLLVTFQGWQNTIAESNAGIVFDENRLSAIRTAYESRLLTDEMLDAAYNKALDEGKLTSEQLTRAEFRGKLLKGDLSVYDNWALNVMLWPVTFVEMILASLSSAANISANGNVSGAGSLNYPSKPTPIRGFKP